MTAIVLEAEMRKDLGKGASRRLRRLENNVPAIIYGGKEEPLIIQLPHNKVLKALENKSIYSSIFSLNIAGKKQEVILKALQRHPYKPVVLHMDFQRVLANDVLIKKVPLHFINEENAKGVKAGGLINHKMTQVEIRCKAECLPEFISVDLLGVGINEVVHLSDLQLPNGVEIALAINDSEHDLPVVSIHLPKGAGTENPETK